MSFDVDFKITLFLSKPFTVISKKNIRIAVLVCLNLTEHVKLQPSFCQCTIILKSPVLYWIEFRKHSLS